MHGTKLNPKILTPHHLKATVPHEKSGKNQGQAGGNRVQLHAKLIHLKKYLANLCYALSRQRLRKFLPFKTVRLKKAFNLPQAIEQKSSPK